MNLTLLLLAIVAVAGAYAYRRYLEAKEKERAAGQWTTLIGLGTKLLAL